MDQVTRIQCQQVIRRPTQPITASPVHIHAGELAYGERQLPYLDRGRRILRNQGLIWRATHQKAGSVYEAQASVPVAQGSLQPSEGICGLDRLHDLELA